MGIYARSPFWWKKYEKDPTTGVVPRKPCSTGIYVDGGSKAQTAQNKADALLQYQADCIAIRKGELAPAGSTKPAILFRKYAAEWLRTDAINNRGIDQDHSHVNALVNGLVPVATGAARPLGEYFLTEITAAVVKAWRVERLKSVVANTVNRETGQLRVMLKHAKAYIGTNPLVGLDTYGDKHFEPLKSEGDKETRWFSREEFARFIAAIEAAEVIQDVPRNEGLALAYTAVETLLRRGNLLRLTWPLYRETHLVPLNPKVKGSIKRSPVTNNMRQYFDLLPRDTPHKLVFASLHLPFTGRPGPKTPVQTPDAPKERLRRAGQRAHKWFNEVCERAGVPHSRAEHGVTFHSFRHTGATWLLQAGESVKVVMTLGGWADANVFIKTYCHATEKEVDAAANRMFPIKFPRAVAKHKES